MCECVLVSVCMCVCVRLGVWARACDWGVKKIEEVIINKALCLCHACAYCIGSRVNVCQHQDHKNAKWAKALNKEESFSLTLE